ncbi:hypothetical protein SDC9_169764 [bioreactor metagenome]|uniref:Uncharacterized protein n=1 Tax=bioreactor metagenome TaxID=1076179 RepID=A0A645G676_9ZZZZ
MLQSEMQFAAQECARGQHHGPAWNFLPEHGFDTRNASVGDSEIHRLSLKNIEIRRIFEIKLHSALVTDLVALSARRPDRRPLAAIEQPKLDGGGIGDHALRSAQCVNFPHHVTLGHTTHRRIAAHLGDMIHIDGKQQCFGAQSGGGQSRFTPGVSGADHDDIVMLHNRFLA